ncbi:MAG: hypothetical protein ACR2L1_07830 [Pyrinomonadaceae bacterium]
MNSEELEVSLRTEFENYLKNVFAEMRQEISQLQEKITSDLDNHRAQLDGVFKEAMSRADREQEFDAGFTESVVEHMRLARDEGARITATAIAEAEEMQKQMAPQVGIKELHEAVNDISTKDSQAEILKTLVQHAGQFTPRGAFFIVKNEHFVGWRTFGSENGESEEAVRDVVMPLASDSLLSESARSLVTVESSAGTYGEDAGILEKLGFGGSPDKMYAIPLVVRGRAVAVLYADYGTQGGEVSAEALETMVRVAGLTVEVLASARSVSAREARKKTSKSFVPAAEQEPKESGQPEYAVAPNFNAQPVDNSYQSSFDSDNFDQPSSFREEPAEESYSSFEEDQQPEAVQEKEVSSGYDSGYDQEEVPSAVQPEEQYSAEEQPWNAVPVESVTEVTAESYSTNYDNAETAQAVSTEDQPDEYSQNFAFQPAVESQIEPSSDFSASPVNDYQFDNQSVGSQPFEESKSENFESFLAPSAEESYAPANEQNFSSFQEAPAQTEVSYEAPVEKTISQPPIEQPPAISTPPVKSRFSERNVDLPIEVSEDERRLHNDARRFARLLVSEIKLYNEQKVKEGRDASDLYNRLCEAIDRSREMYDKRVQPPVAAKFDYFHYEMVNTLAEGDAGRLGSDYPGAAV